MPSGYPLGGSTNLSNFPTNAFPSWNYNYLDGSDTWFYALWDIQVYNMFVDAVNERLAASALCYSNTSPDYSLLLPHAAAGDYILGVTPATNSANSLIGWDILLRRLNLLTATGVGASDLGTGVVHQVSPVRVYEPTGTPLASGTGAANAFYVDPSINGTSTPAPAGTASAFLFSHSPGFFVPHQYPREIATIGATAATSGAHARLIQAFASAAGTNSGHIFTSSGSAWTYDPATLKPDVMEFNEMPNVPCVGGAATGRVDFPLSGDYFTPTFIQRLRDRLNMTVGFLANNAAYLDTNDVYTPGGLGGDGLLILGWRGTGTTLALANTAAAATPFAPAGSGNTWEASAPGAPGNTTGQYLVQAWRSQFRCTHEAPPNGGSFACKLWFGWSTLLFSQSNTADATFGDPLMTDVYGGGTVHLSRGNFIHTSPILPATNATYYRSSVLGPSSFPDGSSGVVTGWDTTGSASSVVENGPDSYVSDRFFCVARYDVAGGFAYTKDTA